MSWFGNPEDINRVVVWFSCGAASAVAAKLALKKYKNIHPVEVVYTDTASEHPDNDRFLSECENWFGQKVKILKSDKYNDIYDVFEKTRYLVGIRGARCTVELKKRCRQEFEMPESDIQVFGFDVSEEKRADRFREQNPEVCLECPLIDNGLDKNDCLAILDKQGIELPVMYKLGYRNNNCVGCVKGQAGYWNKIRIDFPEVFEKMSKMERKLNVAICKKETVIPGSGGKRKRGKVFLDELPIDLGRYKSEADIECGILCYSALDQINDDDDCEV